MHVVLQPLDFVGAHPCAPRCGRPSVVPISNPVDWSGPTGGAGTASTGEPHAVSRGAGAECEVARSGDAIGAGSGASWAGALARRAGRERGGEAPGGDVGSAAEAGGSDRDRPRCALRREGAGDRGSLGSEGNRTDSGPRGCVGFGRVADCCGGTAWSAGVAAEGRVFFQGRQRVPSQVSAVGLLVCGSPGGRISGQARWEGTGGIHAERRASAPACGVKRRRRGWWSREPGSHGGLFVSRSRRHARSGSRNSATRGKSEV